MSVGSYAKVLAEYRARNIRTSEDVLKKGEFILEQNGLGKLGSDTWSFLEQLALAALDLGHVRTANECISRLEKQFPGSPRVECLQGIRLEHKGAYDDALAMYDTILEADPTNAAIWKRRISILRQNGDTKGAEESLITYLDTFYGDPEAWLELADVYASMAMFPQSLSSLSHVLLLIPQNPFYVLQAAETAYTALDIPLALKFFLRSVEMVPEGGASTRGWYGVKLCARRLLSSSTSTSTTTTALDVAASSASETALPNAHHLALLDELATERLLAAYSTSSGGARKNASIIDEKGPSPGSVAADARGVVIRWLQGK